MNKKSILVGSSGVGKSTLVYLLAIYLVLERKKSILVYRTVDRFDQSDCLLFMGYNEADQVVFSSMPATKKVATEIYESLRGQHSDLWLLIDGFPFETIPRGPLHIFNLLVTSQPVNLDSQQAAGT